MRLSSGIASSLLALAAFCISGVAHADHHGDAIGMATFHGVGEIQEFAPDFVV